MSDSLTANKRKPLARTVMVMGLTWLALTVISLLIGLVFFNPFPANRLAKSSVQSEGRVTALEPTNHQIIRYSYRVGAQEYQGSGHDGGGNPAFKDITIGQTVIVFYDPSRPEVSTLGSPGGPLYGNVLGVIFVTLMLPIFIIFSLYRLGYFR
jgi:hypothetical protein